MNFYTTKSINIISLIITLVIFLSINFILKNFFNNQNLMSVKFQQKIEEEVIQNPIEETNEVEAEEEYDWYIEIKSINLKAPIKETTNTDVLAQFVGHFEDTSLKEGNIGLAAHNRGYEVNYFENLKSLKNGDEIIYHYNDFEKIYIVDTIEIIENTDWSYLENSDENKITLITCVENEPNYRRCVQASEKE